MIQRETLRFKFAWISLALIGAAMFVFGLIVTLWPGSSDALFLRAIGVASIGMGLFGVMITVIPYKRRERWAWFTLWYYPNLLASTLSGRIASRSRPYPSGRIHRTLARQSASFSKRILPETGASDGLMLHQDNAQYTGRQVHKPLSHLASCHDVRVYE
jgi:hypothetical protein